MAGRIITSHLQTSRTATPPTTLFPLRPQGASVARPLGIDRTYKFFNRNLSIITNVSAPLAPSEAAPPPTASYSSHAIVIGGSIAGMVAAQVRSLLVLRG